MDASVLKPDDVVYYLAASLDGFIAGPDGDVAWLSDYFSPELGFHDFIARLGGVILGRHTWDKIEGFGKWPYGTIPGTVVTSRDLGKTEAPVTTASGSPDEILNATASNGPGPYWIVGGSDLATQFVQARALTRIDLFTVPVLVGSGTKAFRNDRHIALDLIDTQTYPKGIVRTSWRPARS